jgi:hypothetical protein
MNVPAWIFDRAACLRVRLIDTPQVEVEALICLKALLAEARNRTSVMAAVVGARHPFENRGAADATPQSFITNSSTRSVPSVESSVTRLAMPVGGGVMINLFLKRDTSRALICKTAGNRRHIGFSLDTGLAFD